jgi:mannose-6-phosphate isomerase-like protein (cupin superfamily)
MTVIESVVAPQADLPLHVHDKENEAYYVLEGQFEFVCAVKCPFRRFSR